MIYRKLSLPVRPTRREAIGKRWGLADGHLDPRKVQLEVMLQ